MKRLCIVLSAAFFIGSVLCLAWMIAHDLAHPENWGVTGHRDPRMYLPALAALGAVLTLFFLQAWLSGRRAMTPPDKP